MAICPVCQDSAEVPVSGQLFKFVKCPGCGTFGLDNNAEAELQNDPGSRTLVSHRIRLANERHQEIDITLPMLRTLKSAYQVPSIAQQEDSLLRWMGDDLRKQGQQHAKFQLKDEARRVSSLIGASPPIANRGLMYVLEALFQRGYLRTLPEQYADPLSITPAGWDRYDELTKPKPSAVPYSPRDLLLAIDFLNAVWDKKFGEPLLTTRSTEKIVSLALGCANLEDWKSRLADLHEILRWIEVRESQAILDAKTERGAKIVRLEITLRGMGSEFQYDEIATAIRTLKNIVIVRNKVIHKDSPELIVALASLGIDYPVVDYSDAWDSIRARAAEALHSIRSFLQSV